MLTLSPADAEKVIRLSEERPDQEGRNVGHTISRHIAISRLGLMTRMDAGPGRHDAKAIFWRSAFLDVASAADVLSRAITSLANHPFVNGFSRLPEGEFLIADAEVGQFWCRDQRGRFPAGQVHVYARKMAARPSGLHLITFFPIIKL